MTTGQRDAIVAKYFLQAGFTRTATRITGTTLSNKVCEAALSERDLESIIAVLDKITDSKKEEIKSNGFFWAHKFADEIFSWQGGFRRTFNTKLTAVQSATALCRIVEKSENIQRVWDFVRHFTDINAEMLNDFVEMLVKKPHNWHHVGEFVKIFLYRLTSGQIKKLMVYSKTGGVIRIHNFLDAAHRRLTGNEINDLCETILALEPSHERTFVAHFLHNTKIKISDKHRRKFTKIQEGFQVPKYWWYD